MIVLERATQCLPLRLRPLRFRPQNIRRRDDDVIETVHSSTIIRMVGGATSLSRRENAATAALNCADDGRQQSQALRRCNACSRSSFARRLALRRRCHIVHQANGLTMAANTRSARTIFIGSKSAISQLCFLLPPLRERRGEQSLDNVRAAFTKLPQMTAPGYSAARASGVS